MHYMLVWRAQFLVRAWRLYGDVGREYQVSVEAAIAKAQLEISR